MCEIDVFKGAMNKDKQEWTLLMENKIAEMLESESKWTVLKDLNQ